jgi:uncharacterized damage-inducible protein DinB
MSQMDRFRRMFEHAAWANATTLAALEDGPAPEKARAWLAHLVGAERLWLARLQHEPATMPVWPDLDLAACALEFPALAAAWREYLDTLDDETLEDGVGYRNSKGEFWTSTVGDILTHVLLHAHYHRGQIASAQRDAGGTPAYPDYIHAVRSGLIE